MPHTDSVANQPGKPSAPGQDFEYLIGLMDTLRGAGGCSWTAAQTHESIMHYLVEETYEVVEAVENPGGVNLTLLREELGDVLLNVIFHARMAAEVPAEQGGFDMTDVVNGLSQKLIYRNPHAFGNGGEGAREMTAQQVYDAWDELKKQEKPERTGALDGIPPHLPALARAEKALAKAEKAGVNLETATGGETGTAPGGWASEAELGEHLFAVVAAARAAGLNPERALRTHVQGVIEEHS